MRLTVAVSLTIFNMLFWAFWFYLLMPLKFLPFAVTRRFSQAGFTWIGESWISGNTLIARVLYGLRVEVEGLDHPEIRPGKSYAVMCNHQSYADIFVLQTALNRRIPILRFFIKRELIWFPVMGPIWWAMDYPFVKRHTRQEIQRNPELEGRDERAVQVACEKYRRIPVALLNFLEGHRRTPARMAKLGDANPYRHLLPPKSGGFSLALSALHGHLHGVLDVTLIYPEADVSLKRVMAGKVRRVIVKVDFIPIAEVPVEPDFGQAKGSPVIRDWINARWTRKDALIAARRQGDTPPSPAGTN